jgi:hypothetical protein
MSSGKITILVLLSLFIVSGFDLSRQDRNAGRDSLTAAGDSLNHPNADSSETVFMEELLSVGFQVPKVENRAFQVGEFLVFDVAYGFVVAGSAVMAIPDTQWIHSRPCYRIMTEARSSKFFSKIFEVKDRVVSFVDMEGLFSWRFEKHLREGKYRSDKTVLFDQVNHRVIEGKDTIAVQPFIQDILSSFYFFRTLDLKVGKPVDIDNYGDGKIYPLRVHVLKKETIEVPAGTFRCIVVEPVMRVEGIFKQTGQLRIWLTDDERKMPVLMKSKVLIGSIDARLRKIGKLKEEQ